MPGKKRKYSVKIQFANPAGRALVARIVKKLRQTGAPMTEIAEQERCSATFVYGMNRKYGARTKEEAWDIGARAVVQARQKSRQVCFFTPKEKRELLQRHLHGIHGFARQWYHGNLPANKFNNAIRKFFPFLMNPSQTQLSVLIKRTYPEFDDFLATVQAKILQNLDYYDPNVRGPDGKRIAPFTWIINTVHLFVGETAIARYRRRGNRELQMPVTPDGKPITEAFAVDVPHALGTAKARWIPGPTRIALKKLGIDISNSSTDEIKGIRRNLLEISKSPEARLTQREQDVFRLALKGYIMKAVSARITTKRGKPLSREMIRQVEQQAISKIRRAIARARYRTE